MKSGFGKNMKKRTLADRLFQPVASISGMICRKLSAGLYDFQVFLKEKFRRKERAPEEIKGVNTRNKKRLIFYILMMALPVIHFCVFYLAVNINSILLAFKEYNIYTGKYSFVGFTNFIDVLSDFKGNGLLTFALKNSFILLGFTVGVGITGSLVFSFYIHKKAPLSGVFQVMFFMPHIISSVVLVIMFKYFAENAIPEVYYIITKTRIEGLLSNDGTRFATLIFYSVWIEFGMQMLLYSGAMNGINESVIESAQIDGCSLAREFFHITLPLIYPTIVTFLVVKVAATFTNQLSLFSFYGIGAPPEVYTFGYYLYSAMKSNRTTIGDYPYLASLGLILTLVTIPVVLTLRRILEKAGPKT
jgi:ABC-type sugar transport system permease subunit